MRVPKLFSAFLINVLLLVATNIYADHIPNIYLYYTWVSGDTYNVTLVADVNCRVPTGSLPGFTVSQAKVFVYDSTTLIDSLTMPMVPADTGIEVTSLCAGDSSTCESISSSIIGERRYVYSANYTLPHTSAVWRFIFTGNASTYQAQRKVAITNLSSWGTNFQLIDTLNNISGHNSNVIFGNSHPVSLCMSSPNDFNLMATDPDGDSLDTRLATPVIGTGTSAVSDSLPTYYTGASESEPFQSMSGGLFSMNSASGEMVVNYPGGTPQWVAVLFTVREFRSGTLIGSCQRELAIYVNTCGSTTPCSGTPYCGDVALAGMCGAPDTVSLPDASPGCGYAYQWQYSTDSISWTNISGATNSTYIFYPASLRYYRGMMTCAISGGGSNYSTARLIVRDTALRSSIYPPTDTMCNSPVFHVMACDTSSSNSVVTYYGDGTNDTHLLSSTVPFEADFTHTYGVSGHYTIRQYLYEGSLRADSSSYSYNYTYCRTLPFSVFYDANRDCVFDSGDTYFNLPLLFRVDSNGVPIDTISCTSGFYYATSGPAGTIYTFSLISSGSLALSCAGPISDTIQAFITDYPRKSIGVYCTGGSIFDLAVNADIPVTGPRDQWGNIYASNYYCFPEDAFVTLYVSPRYSTSPAAISPAPYSVSGNSITWHLPGLSCLSPMDSLHRLYYAVWDNPLTGTLTPGDTVQEHIYVTPTAGDADTSNNDVVIIDTVKASCDPNEMMVKPAGYISAGTQLQYTIDFENTGNAPAQNIYVMDTLSDDVDPRSLRMVMSSAVMNIAQINDGRHNIVKFDLPNIHLLDSSHHGQCDGMLIFNINTYPGLHDGTVIDNRSGIYFDDNSVVMTNGVEDIIGLPGTLQVPSPAHSNIKVSPNPTTGELNISIPDGTYNTLVIYNTLGQQMMQYQVAPGQTKLNVTTLPTGVYYLSFKGLAGVTTQKFVKM